MLYQNLETSQKGGSQKIRSIKIICTFGALSSTIYKLVMNFLQVLLTPHLKECEYFMVLSLFVKSKSISILHFPASFYYLGSIAANFVASSITASFREQALPSLYLIRNCYMNTYCERSRLELQKLQNFYSYRTVEVNAWNGHLFLHRPALGCCHNYPPQMYSIDMVTESRMCKRTSASS